MKRFVTYLIMAAGTLYIAVLYGSTSFLMLFYLEILLPVMLFIVSIPMLRGIWVQLRLPISIVEKGQNAVVELWLQNKGIIPSGRIAVQVTCHFPMNRKPEKTWFYGRVSAGKRLSQASSKFFAEFAADCVGNVKLEITKVKCYDLLGLVALPLPKGHWRQLEPETLLVLPKISEVPVYVTRQSRDFAGEAEEYSKQRGGDDPSETFQIRDYQPGDKLRSIHWKLSVKTGEMMVNEHSLPLGCPVVFYLNLYHPSLIGKRRGRKKERKTALVKKGQAVKRDSYLQIVASISQAMVRERCRHYIVWFDTGLVDIQRCRVETEEDVYEMLLEMGKLSMYSEKIDMEELYRQKYHESPCITKLELTMDLSLQQNGVRAAKYSEKEDKLDKQLGEIEIIV